MVQLVLNLVGLLAVVGLCAVVAIVGFTMVRRNRNLIDNGLRVLSTVVAVRPISIDSSFAYEPTVRYELHGRMWDSVPYEGRHALKTGKVFNSHRSGEQFVGMRLPVVVDSRDPRISAVPKGSRLGITLVVVGLVMGGLILLFGTLGVLVAAFM
ncbi:MAG TPA: DUF3592 domain-containing protein [Brevibacterium senegalense]|uniref:DUF3592 domain-containing protein n=1 Tax=Brevibacterium senegalense TaxID=1033736 RepID=A0A921MEF1_9MICO|nr:DUF3592 domain-containing protein [Brevibacterium senegalense]